MEEKKHSPREEEAVCEKKIPHTGEFLSAEEPLREEIPRVDSALQANIPPHAGKITGSEKLPHGDEAAGGKTLPREQAPRNRRSCCSPKKDLRPLAFLAALILAVAAELLPESLYAAAAGVSGAQLLRQTAVLLPCAAALFLLFVRMGHGQALLRPSFPPRGTRVACLLLFLVALNNFPFYACLRGFAAFRVDGGMLALYTAATLLTAAAEELLFRGILFPAIYAWLRMRGLRREAAEASETAARERREALYTTPAAEEGGRETAPLGFSPAEAQGEEAPAAAPAGKSGKCKRGTLLLALLLSSFLFGGAHLVNLFAGASPIDAFLQIGYSTLIGAAAAFLFLATDSLWPPILFHFVYNFGGLFVPTFGTGALSLPPVILSTAVLSLAAAAAAARGFFYLSPRRNAFIKMS